jgi:probable rRNA maturation factor
VERAIEVFNHQTAQAVDLRRLQRFAELVYEKVRGLPCPEGHGVASVLKDLPGVEVTIVGDEVIAEVHERFMGIPGATDVITFEHGEIVISAETARVQGQLEGTRCDEEIGLYLVHGLLHLLGYDDRSEATAAGMRSRQDEIFREFWEVTDA